MAGQKTVNRLTTFEDGLKDREGRTIIGLRITEIVENGNVEAGDEWALFRLTDDALRFYNAGPDFAAGIMGLTIHDKPAVVEIGRHKTKEDAVEAKGRLSPEEQHRTLLRSVEPK